MTQREDVRFKVYTKASVDVFGSNTTAAARGAPRHDQRRGGWGLRRGPFVSISISWIANASGFRIMKFLSKDLRLVMYKK